eukprot:SAG11_NODE_9932_length_869_cov_0.776623_1_plen_36_part_10
MGRCLGESSLAVLNFVDLVGPCAVEALSPPRGVGRS